LRCKSAIQDLAKDPRLRQTPVFKLIHDTAKEVAVVGLAVLCAVVLHSSFRATVAARFDIDEIWRDVDLTDFA
jgi:hypothetical protein